MNKKNIIIIALIVLLALVCFGIGVVLLEPSDSTSSNYTGEYKPYQTIDISKCHETVCSEDFTFNGNTLHLDVDENLSYQLRYNKKMVASFNGAPSLGNTIYTFDDKILYSSNYSEYSMLLTVYDPKTKENTNFELTEDTQWTINDVEVEENKIRIYTSRFDDPLYFIDVKNQIPVVMDNCENYQNYAEVEAAKIFEITYKDGSFHKAKEVSTILLKDYKEYHTLCGQ